MDFLKKLFKRNKSRNTETEPIEKIDITDSTDKLDKLETEITVESKDSNPKNIIEKTDITDSIDELDQLEAEIAVESKDSNPKNTVDNFIEKSLENKYQELEDNRWFSHFKELPEIDRLKKIGDNKAALELCLQSLETHSDSFLFYSRASVLYDNIDKPQDAIKILKAGLLKSLSKCSLAQDIADKAFKRNNYRDAIFWWIQAGVIQIESKILVEYIPFLNLAYLCQPIGFEKEEKWFFSMADRISTQGPIRFNSDGVNLRHKLIQQATGSNDSVVLDAIKEFYNRYNNN